MEPVIKHPLLVCLDRVPSSLLEVPPQELDRVLPGPTLLEVPGRGGNPLFISVLLHGNETTGLLAIQQLLRTYHDRVPPRPLSIFFGNIAASRQGLRRLDDQVDYNRIWPGTELGAGPEVDMAAAIVDAMRKRPVFASIDVHNNTGTNPHYTCVHEADRPTLNLASMFGRLCIHARRPRGTQTEAFSSICPSVTLECGKPGHEFGVRHAFEFLDACLHLSQIPTHQSPPGDLELYESLGQVLVRPDIQFGFDDPAADLDLIADLDHMNFVPLEAGRQMGSVRGATMPLEVIDVDGSDVAERYFRIDEGRLLLARPAMPAMLTLDPRVIRQDCLGYLMERVNSMPV